MTPPADRQVTAHDGIRLAVRDHGGDGPPIVLLHGAGSHLLGVEPLVRHLGDHRVVTMDQRWSGQSGDSDIYRWDDLTRDVESVVDSLDLGNPAVGGHSWGGMIAVHYAARHPEVPAVFNLDGNGPGDLSLYDGTDPADFEALNNAMAEPPAYLGAEGDATWKHEAVADVARTFRALGVAPEDAGTFAERSFLALPDGRWRRHPSRQMYEGLTGDQKMFDLYRRIEAPVLVVLSGGSDWGPPAAAPLMAAYRRGLLRAFAEHPHVRVVEMTGSTHSSLTGADAEATAAVVAEYLQSVGYR